MNIQKMIHIEDGKKNVITHAVNEAVWAGEFTICGLDIVESKLSYNGFEKEGEEYQGKLKDLDCLECLKIIKFCKNLK